jgi:hypothetical protein
VGTMIPIVVLVFVLATAVLAQRFGHDSRPHV